MISRLLVLGLVTASVTLVLACSDNDTGTTSGNGASSGSSAGSGFKQCAPATQSSCTDADMKPYNDCLQAKCGSAYAKCYGPDYNKGSFSGPCGDFITCAQKCDCNDTACVQQCVTGMSSTECSTCSKDFETCGASCTLPACASVKADAGSAGGGTCADLEACCNVITDADQKGGCIQAKDGAQGNDATCASYYNAFKSGGMCP